MEHAIRLVIIKPYRTYWGLHTLPCGDDVEATILLCDNFVQSLGTRFFPAPLCESTDIYVCAKTSICAKTPMTTVYYMQDKSSDEDINITKHA